MIHNQFYGQSYDGMIYWTSICDNGVIQKNVAQKIRTIKLKMLSDSMLHVAHKTQLVYLPQFIELCFTLFELLCKMSESAVSVFFCQLQIRITRNNKMQLASFCFFIIIYAITVLLVLFVN